jgi:hypothetical protein
MGKFENENVVFCSANNSTGSFYLFSSFSYINPIELQFFTELPFPCFLLFYGLIPVLYTNKRQVVEHTFLVFFSPPVLYASAAIIY